MPEEHVAEEGVEEEVEEEELEDESPATHEEELAQYLQSRIKPGLSKSTIPLVARSIAKELARHDMAARPAPDAGAEQPSEDEEPSDFEQDMRDLQAELGEDWILRFSVTGDDAWLTAEKLDASQHIEATNAEGLIRIVDAIDDGGR
jgi:hypothetical protein